VAGLLDHGRGQPQRPAVVFGDDRFVETYAELESRSRKIALALRSRGLAEGDSVATLIGNSKSFFDVYWATQRIGLYLTPLSYHATPHELAYILGDCDARVLIAAAEFGELARAAAELAGRDLAVRLSIGGDIAGFQPLDSSLSTIRENASLVPQHAGSVMIYSSGTTGQPKGIRRALPGAAVDDPRFVDAVTLVMRTFGFRSDDVYLCPAPLYHSGPLRSCTAMQMLGATVVVMHKFDAEKALQIIDEHGVTVAQFVPTHFKRMLELPAAVRSRWRHDSLRTVVHAAAPCPPDVKHAMIDWWGPILLEYYAGTEGGGVLIDSHEWLRKPGSVGRPWQGLSVAVFNEDGDIEATPRREGRIYFRNHPGALANFAYHKDPEKTAAAYRGNWFTLGDIGYLDEDGYLYLTDRQSNLIISGGVNIYPQEAENVLAGHPKVADVAVVGVPDDDMGEAVKAVIVPADGVAGDGNLADELLAYVRSRLASYKCPRTVDFVDSLPRTPSGKLQKRLVRERYWQGRVSRLT
jgi:acyl-CoA synthetase (AMP-forming)/AMP-acid ligase II